MTKGGKYCIMQKNGGTTMTIQNEHNIIKKREKLTIAKRNDLIQQLRFNLSRNEQLCVLYAISKIKPTDTIQQEYDFDILEFKRLIDIEDCTNVYVYLKKLLKNIRDKSAWVTSADGKSESIISWFGSVTITKGTGKVKIKFDEKLQPYLIDLHQQYLEKRICYTTYNLMMVLKMKSKYGIRLYELIKSYENTSRWEFEIQELKELMCAFDKDGKPLIPKTWSDFNHFKNKVIEPAIADINNSSDLHIGYDTECAGRKVVKVTFFYVRKTEEEFRKIFASGFPVTKFEDFDEQKFEEFMENLRNDKEYQFKKEHSENYLPSNKVLI